MKIFLDDVRETPKGYTRTYTVEETINIIKENNGNIEIVSLDNDLGIGYEEGRKVLDWIEENDILPFNILLHTMNPVARNLMKVITKRIYNKWDTQKKLVIL